MGFAGTALITTAAFVVIALCLTRPAELREHRWTRILLSFPAVLLVSWLFYAPLQALIGSVAIINLFYLAMVWKSVFAHYLAGGVGQLVFGSMNARTGVHADFRFARSCKEQGNIVEAIEAVELELQKEPLSYEGLWLLSGLHQAEGDLINAAAPLEKSLRSNTLTSEQRRFVREHWEKLNAQIVTGSGALVMEHR